MRSSLTILFTIFLASSAPVVADLSRFSEYKNGIEALENHLPEQAVTRFQKVLASAELKKAEKSRILMKLCEAQVRARMGRDAELTLSNALLKDHPDRSFWLGQALIAQGNYGERSIDAFKEAAKKEGKYRGLAMLALSQIYKILNETEKAYEALEQAAGVTELSIAAYLELAEGFLEKGDLKKVETILKKLSPKSEVDTGSVLFLKAQLYFKQQKYSEAKELYQKVLSSDKVKPVLKESCSLGLADVMVAEGDVAAAIEKIIGLIEGDLESYSLYLMFGRLIEWSPQLDDDSELNAKLEEWIKAPEVLLSESGEVEKKQEMPYPDRNAFSHYLLAKNLGGQDTESSAERALDLLVKLRKNHELHFLKERSYILTAQICEQLGRLDEAKLNLDKLAKLAKTAELRANAIFLKGEITAEKNQDGESMKAFKAVMSGMETRLSEAAKVNLALLQLRNRSLSAFTDTVGKVKNDAMRQGLLFERASRALAKGQPNGRDLLVEFLQDNPEAEMKVEAKLLLANDLLAYQPLNIALSTKLIKEVQKDEKATVEALRKSHLLESQVHILNQNWEQAVVVCEKLVEGEEVEDERILITLGEAYYRNGEFNKARKVLNQVVSDFPKSPYLEHCYFFAALSAKKEETPQSQDESLELFNKVIALNGNLKSEAFLQKARLLIDRENLTEAMAVLEKGLSQKGVSPDAQKNLKVLLADTLHRKGGKEKNPEFYAKAIQVYNELLSLPDLTPIWSNRLYYLKGQTQEKVDPTYAASLNSYFAVVNLENQKNKLQPVEWEWYYKSGLRAVDLLEREERWKAAVSLLEKMAGYGGPKTDVLSERARKIRLAEQFW